MSNQNNEEKIDLEKEVNEILSIIADFLIKKIVDAKKCEIGDVIICLTDRLFDPKDKLVPFIVGNHKNGKSEISSFYIYNQEKIEQSIFEIDETNKVILIDKEKLEGLMLKLQMK